MSAATSVCLALALCLLPVEVVGTADASEARHLPEGAKTRVEVNRYERNPANRASCIAHFGTKCLACGIDFGVAYGELGDGYIEVHHRIPVSKMGAGYFVDPVRDLAPLCANCHAMVHRTDPPMEIEELRRQLARRNSLTWPMV